MPLLCIFSVYKTRRKRARHASERTTGLRTGNLLSRRINIFYLSPRFKVIFSVVTNQSTFSHPPLVLWVSIYYILRSLFRRLLDKSHLSNHFSSFVLILNFVLTQNFPCGVRREKRHIVIRPIAHFCILNSVKNHFSCVE